MEFLARFDFERNSGKKKFLAFSAYLIPFWLKIMSERGFLIFWIFLLFFWEFSCSGLVWTEFGTKIFFFVFLGLSHPVLDKNNAGKRFFNFLIFVLFFFQNFLARVEYEQNSELNFFFLSFSAYLIPFWLKIIAERGFSIFWFFSIFFGIFMPGSSINGIWD